MSASEPWPAAEVYARFGVRRVVNAADTYTALGGGALPGEVRAAMAGAAAHHVDVAELLAATGAHLARLTRNEAALVVNGAAAGLALAVAACIAGPSPAAVDHAPAHRTDRRRVVLLRCQRNPYDRAVAQAGAEIVEIGYADATHPWQLAAELGPRTAAVVLFAGTQFERYGLALEEVVRLAHDQQVPVIIDAAAQLPPVENLWHYTGRGADLVLFSGGKGLRGPQSSGLVLGRAELVAACRAHAYPNHALGRAMKTSKENVLGLVAAVERALGLDWAAERGRWEAMVGRTIDALATVPGVRAWRVPSGRLGQQYPRAFFAWDEPGVTAAALATRLAAGNPAVHIGHGEDGPRTAYVNPFVLDDPAELDLLLDRLVPALERRT
ncbi:hypothetical protein [Dactylosporangium sp. CA-092794]|uniref:hypothetical protein n=1 Tax=Dactylosporangium sp. CA-092794 TaxID=3239929 RepID=UPI003D941BF3